MQRPKLLSFIICMFLLSTRSEADAPDRDLTGFEDADEAQPLWEVGVAGVAGEVPNYPSSSERNFFGVAAPYFVYRGDMFRVGSGGGARAVVAEDDKFEIDISVSGALSANSEDNTAREDMPELDFLFEIGPQLVYRLRDFKFSQGGNAKLNGRLQARSVFSTDFGRVDHRGYVLEPTLSYQQRGVWIEDVGFNLSLGFTFATEKLHDYFYQVDSEFVTANRPLYDAKSGYLGSELGLSVSFKIMDNIRAFSGIQLQALHGAANEDSPLFEDKLTYGFAMGIVWRLYESDAKASW